MSFNRKNINIGKFYFHSKKMWLRKFEYLDEKWLKCNLNGALKDPFYTRSAIFNTLIQDNELSDVRFPSVINAIGRDSYPRSDGKYYCGRKVLSCSCCEGVCGPNSSCVCDACQIIPGSLELAEDIQNHHEKVNDNTSTSESYFESWMWGPIPGKLANKSYLLNRVLFNKPININSKRKLHMGTNIFFK